MDDKHLQYLKRLREGIVEYGENPNVKFVSNGTPVSSLKLQVLAYATGLANKDENLTAEFFPQNLENKEYRDNLTGQIDSEISQYEQAADKDAHIVSNLPNIIILERADQNIRQAAAPQINPPVNPYIQQIEEHNQNWIQRMRDSILENTGSYPHEQLWEIEELTNQKTEDFFTNLSHLNSPDSRVVQKQIEAKGAEILRNIKDTGIPVNFTEAQKQISSLAAETSAVYSQKAQIQQAYKEQLRQTQISLAWEEIKLGIIASSPTPLPPDMVDKAAAHVASQITWSGNHKNINITNLIEKGLQECLQNPLVGINLPGTVTAQKYTNGVAQVLSPSASNFVSAWQQNLPSQSIQENQNAWNIVSSNSPQTSPVAVNQYIQQGIPFADRSPQPLEVLSSHGRPFNLLISAVSPQSGKDALVWTAKGGPIKTMAAAITDIIAPDRISASLASNMVNDLILNQNQYRQYYLQNLQKLSWKKVDDLNPEEYFTYVESKRALDFLDELEKNRDRIQKTFYAKWTNRYSKWIRPLDHWQQQLILKHPSYWGLLGYQTISITRGVLKHPDMALLYLPSYVNMFAGVFWKEAGLRAGLYELHGPPMMKHYVFKLTYHLKTKINFVLHKAFQKLTSKILSDTARIAVGTFLTTVTAGIGSAFVILSKIWAPIKKFAQISGMWAFGLILQFGLPGLIGAGVGFLVGGIGGGLLGAKIGALLLGWIPGVGVIAGGFVGFIVGFVVGSGLGAIIGAYVGHWLAGAVATIGNALSSFLNSLVSSFGKSLAIFTGQLVFGSIIVVSSLTVYTFWVTSAAFFVPSGDHGLIGSPYIEISKAADVAGVCKNCDVQNSVIGPDQKVVYELIIIAKEKSLTNIVITDTGSVFNENGTTPISNKDRFVIAGKNSAGKYVFGDSVPEKWDSSNTPALAKLDSGSSIKIFYGIKIEDLNKFKDSLVNNFVTVKAQVDGKEEQNTLALSFKIGSPPVPKTAENALLLLQRLHSCYPDTGNPGDQYLSKTNSANYGKGECVKQSSLNPAGFVVNEAALAELYQSVNVGTANVLQCIGFVQAVLDQSGTPFSTHGDANAYYGYNQDGFKWHTDLQNIQEGDVFIAKWSVHGGHAGIVANVVRNKDNPKTDYFLLAEALGYIHEPPVGQEPNWSEAIAHYPSKPYIIVDWLPKADPKTGYVGFLRYEP